MHTPRRMLTASAAIATLLGGAVAAAPSAANGSGSDNVTHVSQHEFADLHGRGANQGTDIEFATVMVEGEERTYSLSGTYHNGLLIHDITDPENVTLTSTYDCGISQGDVQAFQREDEAGVLRTYVAFTNDDGYGGHVVESACIEWAMDNAAEAYAHGGGNGTYIADITDPANPVTVSLVGYAKGSHNITVHPSGNYLYNSNSDLLDYVTPGIEVTDITDLTSPELVTILPLQARPGLGGDSHDITFNHDGTRAFSASIGATTIIDTTDPENPSIVSVIEDPAVNVEHEAESVFINDPILGEREFLIVEDEFGGATPTGQCPNGGVHVYDITGELELAPVKVGFWNIAIEDTGPTRSGVASCTAHVFQLHPEHNIMTIAYYNGGVRVVDYTNVLGVSLGAIGTGMKEIGWFRFDDMNAWAVKAPFVSRDGVWHMYSGDINRGMDVYRVDLTGAEEFSQNPGEWLTPDQALGRTLRNPVDLATYTPSCLLGQERFSRA